MNPFRSVGARLAAALAIVVAVALAVVYVVLVPALQRRLETAKLNQLDRSRRVVVHEYSAVDPDFVTTAQATANARVVVYQLLSASPATLTVLDDSLEGRSAVDVADDPVALKSAITLTVAKGFVTRDDTPYADVAFPVSSTRIVLLTASLRDSLANVDVVRRRIIWAGLIALAAAVALGYGAASLFARRIRRLERAADRIAAGDFSEPVVDVSRDELGELARAFERMRGRLAQLEDARSAFIANASHELRTPIFSLGGFLELLRDEDLDEPTRSEFLATMGEQVERLTRLATDLLDLSRLDAGRLRVEREPVELSQIADELAAEFAPVAHHESHPLEVAIEARAVALADGAWVERVGRLLLENALTHTPPGTPVRLAVRAPAELAVEDAGPGIPSDRHEQVFERFTRLESARSAGSGLGLAIARELAELMGGTIRLESRPGRTVFALVLPAAPPTDGGPAKKHVETTTA
jgi:signal transduction histidine kinase